VSVAVVSRFLAMGAVVVNVATVVLVVDLFRPVAAVDAVRRHALSLAAAMAVLATAGSLYYSEVAGYPPCVLCWYQRIAMYPLVIVLGVAAWRRDRAVWRTGLPIVAIGAAISTYHVLIERVPSLATESCQVDVPCTVRWVWELGFVSIPFMALTAFLFIGALLLGVRQQEHEDVVSNTGEAVTIDA
jgi:disulfide bond formation protein DsbB